MKQFYFSKRSETFLADINSNLENIAREALKITRIDFAIISGKRNMAEQRELVRKGASRTLNSKHLKRNAIDIALIDLKTGKGNFERGLAPENSNSILPSRPKPRRKNRMGRNVGEF